MNHRAKIIAVAAGLCVLVSAGFAAQFLGLWEDSRSAGPKPVKSSSTGGGGIATYPPVDLPDFDVASVCDCYWNPSSSDDVPSESLASIDPEAAKSFEAVQRIFVERCVQCHGPDQQEGGLRLDQAASAMAEADSGALPIVPGDLEHSELMRRVRSEEEELRMPADGPPLSVAEIETLQNWITLGAPWPKDAGHWAFRKPVRPRLPEVQNGEWPRNPVDQFILARLEEEGLAPSPEADRTTLVRRLYLDLIGLPPTPVQVDEFLADQSPDAYERLVDRLLSSPYYGERFAVHWLDLARYADTDGYEHDGPRKMWLFRDYVIHALNSDMPFDRFTVEQLAGDLLPESTDTQKIATGFMRNAIVAIDLRQYRFETMIDRVNTMGVVWLGLSMNCVQCHDHKFDPVSQKEYYQVYSIFDMSADDLRNDGHPGGPVLRAHSPLKITGAKSTTGVLVDDGVERPAFVKIRGSFHMDGEEVQPGVPAEFHKPQAEVKNRLGLACWLTDKQNPLTARVMVNRYWEWIFGTGIVRTSEDLGTRSEPPSHKELLDWLAVEFVESGWSMKRIIRLIVTSATYRQSSHVTPESLEHDPRNRLLGRGARFRLNAESIRNVALTASGLLAVRVGGPSVFPLQPPGVNKGHFMVGDFEWKEDRDRNRYRRGVYTFWKRTSTYPSLALFNAPRREKSCPRRTRSNTPLQALVTLNDPAYFEAAVHLGKRMMTEAGEDFSDRLRRGYRLCLSREPRDEELTQLRKYYDVELSSFQQEAEAAKTLLVEAGAWEDNQGLDASEWAAWAMVANVLLNLDETITKE